MVVLPSGGVAHPHQQGHDDPVGDDGGAALGEEGHRHTGERDEAGDAARDHEDLEGDDRGEAGGQKAPEGIAQGEAGAEAALHQQGVEQEDRGEAGEAQFLARRGQDEVRLGGEADQDGVAEAEAGAEQPAGGEREEGLGELVGALARLDGREGVQPVLDAAVDVRFEPADGHRAHAREQQPHRDPSGAARGDVQHDHEQAEEQQRGAQIAFQDQDADAQQPDGDDRAEDAPGGQLEALEPPDLAPGVRQRVAVRREIAGEEQCEQHLRELARLEGEPRDPHPDPGPVDRREQDRQRQQGQRGHHRDVRVPLEHPVVAQQGHDRDEQRHPERRPVQLRGRRQVGRGLQVEPVDQHQAKTVEEHGDRQQQRIGVRRPQTHHQMGQQREHAEPGAVVGGAGRDGAVLRQTDGAVAVHGEQDGHDGEGELDASAPEQAYGGRGRLRGIRRQGRSGIGGHDRNLPKWGALWVLSLRRTSVAF